MLDQLLMQDKMDKFRAAQKAEQKPLNTLSENTDERIADLIAAIGNLTERSTGVLE